MDGHHTTLYVARHGESEANVGLFFSNSLEVHGLTDLGRCQAESLADRLSEARIEWISASPVLRAKQTAEIVASKLKAPLDFRKDLVEFDVGELEGKSYKPYAQDYFDAQVHRWICGEDRDVRMAGGENVPMIVERMQREFSRQAELGGIRLVVTHGGVLRMALPAIVNNLKYEDVYGLSMRPATYIILECRNGEWTIVQDSEWR